MAQRWSNKTDQAKTVDGADEKCPDGGDVFFAAQDE